MLEMKRKGWNSGAYAIWVWQDSWHMECNNSVSEDDLGYALDKSPPHRVFWDYFQIIFNCQCSKKHGAGKLWHHGAGPLYTSGNPSTSPLLRSGYRCRAQCRALSGSLKICSMKSGAHSKLKCRIRKHDTTFICMYIFRVFLFASSARWVFYVDFLRCYVLFYLSMLVWFGCCCWTADSFLF